MKRASTIVLAAVVLSVTFVLAQNPPAPPKPGPEVAKLKYFLGNWKMEGDTKPGPMGPGGKYTATSRNELMAGGFYIVLHGAGDMGAMGKYTNAAFLGYDAENKVYIYNEFTSTGEHVYATGVLAGDTWTWTNENKMDGKVMKGRFTEKITSPTSYDFKYEFSMDGSPFTTVVEGKATKSGSAPAASSGKKPATSSDAATSAKKK